MLQRTTQFLQKSTHSLFPALFLVLPLPCVENSRYLTKEHLSSIMASLGYILVQSKESKRMAYWLYRWNGTIEETAWKKKIIRDGGGRNNFAIRT
jgi:25S rRNA (adenine2142-N1)-methyltransferase